MLLYIYIYTHVCFPTYFFSIALSSWSSASIPPKLERGLGQTLPTYLTVCYRQSGNVGNDWCQGFEYGWQGRRAVLVPGAAGLDALFASSEDGNALTMP